MLLQCRSKACKEILVVNVSSVSATQPYEAFSVYAAGKSARLMLARTLAREAELLHNPSARQVQQQDSNQAAHAQHGSQEQGSSLGGESTSSCSEAISSSHSRQLGSMPVILSLSYAPGALDTDMQVGGEWKFYKILVMPGSFIPSCWWE